MFVIKRDGRKQEVSFDKITARIQKLCYGLDPEHVDPILVSMKVIEGLYDGVTTTELDNLAAEVAATMTVRHPDYALAGRADCHLQSAEKHRKILFQDDSRPLSLCGSEKRQAKPP